MPPNLPATICILPVFIPIAHAAHLPLRTRVISSTVSRKIELSWLAGWSALFCIFAFYTAIETAAVDLGEKSKKKKILNDMKTCFPGKPIVIGWPAVNQSWWRNGLRRISHLRNNQFQLGRTWKLQVSIHQASPNLLKFNSSFFSPGNVSHGQTGGLGSKGVPFQVQVSQAEVCEMVGRYFI